VPIPARNPRWFAQVGADYLVVAHCRFQGPLARHIFSTRTTMVISAGSAWGCAFGLTSLLSDASVSASTRGTSIYTLASNTGSKVQGDDQKDTELRRSPQRRKPLDKPTGKDRGANAVARPVYTFARAGSYAIQRVLWLILSHHRCPLVSVGVLECCVRLRPPRCVSTGPVRLAVMAIY